MILSIAEENSTNHLAVTLSCAGIGIIIGGISATGLGVKFSQAIIGIGQGNLFLALILAAACCLMIGMGLPTAASYLMVVYIAAPAITALGLPMLTAHLFIFYYACMSAITPPVAVCAYAGAGIAGAGGNPGDCEGVIPFPDEELADAVRWAAFEGRGGDIYDEDVAELEQLSALGCGITDLTGLQCLTSLTVLDLTRNDIRDVSPLSGLIGLDELYLGANAIVDVSPLSGLVGLSGLSLNINAISDVGPLVANSGLASGDWVDLDGNPIDCAEQASNLQALRDRGVTVQLFCP